MDLAPTIFPVADKKIFRRQVWVNPRLIVSSCILCDRIAASTDLHLLFVVEGLHECQKKNNSPDSDDAPNKRTTGRKIPTP